MGQSDQGNEVIVRMLYAETPHARKARLTDIPLLFEWVNDSVNRANSVSRNRVGLLEHVTWFLKNYRSQRNFLVLVEQFPKNPGPRGRLMFCGFRFAGGVTWEVSVNLNPAFRGMGLSRSLLLTAMDFLRHETCAPATLVAVVRRENTPSLRMFLGLGFQEFDGDGSFIRLRGSV